MAQDGGVAQDGGEGGAAVAGAGGNDDPGGAGGSAGVVGNPCASCDRTEECVDGECRVLPGCDCEANGVQCSPLRKALEDDGETYRCPAEVQCGSCEPGGVCLITDNPSLGRRVCVPDDSPSCMTPDEVEPQWPSPTTCPREGEPSFCSVPYAACSTIVSTSTGERCWNPGTYWTCGPPL